LYGGEYSLHWMIPHLIGLNGRTHITIILFNYEVRF